MRYSLSRVLSSGHQDAAAPAEFAAADLCRCIDRGLLQGVRLEVQDIIIAPAIASTTANSKVLDPTWADATTRQLFAKRRQAGAVILGKLGLAEFACGMPDHDPGFRIPQTRGT